MRTLLKTIFILYVLVNSQLTYGQIVNDNFDDNVIPDSWSEITSTGNLNAINQQLVFSMVDGVRKQVTAKRLFPEGITDKTFITFDFATQDEIMKAYVTIYNESDQPICMLWFGDGGKKGIMYVNSVNAANDPVDRVKLTGLKRNTLQNVKFELDVVSNKVTVKIDDVGFPEATDMAFLNPATSIGYVVVDFRSIWSQKRKIRIDDFIVSKSDVSKLNGKVREATQMLESALVGAEVGQYSTEVYDTFSGVITASESVLTNVDAQQAAVDAAYEEVSRAIVTFKENMNAKEISIAINTSKGFELIENMLGYNPEIPKKKWQVKNPVFKQALKESGNGTLRFQSGTPGDYFDWRTGIADVEMLHQQRSIKAAGNKLHDLAAKVHKYAEVKPPCLLDDAYKTVSELGQKLVVTINGYTDTPESAYELALFCKNNHIQVEVFKLANEPNWKLFSADKPEGHYLNGYDYVVKMKPFADAILRADPEAQLALMYGWDSFSLHNGIKRYELEQGGRYWHYLNRHSYKMHSKDVDFASAARRGDESLNFFTSDKHIQYIRDRGWEGAPIIITEFGTWNDKISKTIYDDLYSSEYILRHNSISNYKFLMKQEMGMIAKFYNTPSVEDAYKKHEVIDFDTAPAKLSISLGNQYQIPVFKTVNKCNYTWNADVSGALLDRKRKPSVYSRAYRGNDGNNYLIVNSRSAKTHRATLTIDGRGLSENLTVARYYAWDAAYVGYALADTITASETLEIMPNSVTVIKWSGSRPADLLPTRVWDGIVENDGITLKWWQREAAEGYKLYYGTDVDHLDNIIDITGFENNQYKVTSLTPGVKYYFKVSCIRSTEESELSDPIDVKYALPEVPVLNTCHPRNGRILLHWTSVADVEGYRVHLGRSPGSYTEVIDAKNSVGYLLKGLENGVEYYVAISAYNNKGESGISEEKSSTPNTDIPFSPHTLIASELDNGSVSLTWESPDSTAIDMTYSVYRSESPLENYTKIADGITETAYIDESSMAIGRYYYTVKSVGANGESFIPCIERTLIKTMGSTGIKLVSEQSVIKVFPTIFNDCINIDSDVSIERVEMFDLHGVKCPIAWSKNSRTVEVNFLSSGMYFLRVYTKEDVYLQKLIKK